MAKHFGRRLLVREMVSLEGIYRLGETENVLRLWRAWNDATQAEVASGLGVPTMMVCVLERWGVEGVKPEYQGQLETVIEGLREWGITPEMLGLQYKGLKTRFGKMDKEEAEKWAAMRINKSE